MNMHNNGPVSTNAAGTGIGNVKSVTKAVSILDQLANQSNPMGTRELAAAVNLPKTTVQRLLETLDSAGLVTPDELGRGYRLAPKVFHLGMTVLRQTDVRTVALPYMHKLRDHSGETVGLNIRVDQYQRMLIEQLESFAPIRFKAEVGALYPLVAGAPGRALLSGLSQHELKSLADDARLHTVAKGQLRSEDVKEVRRRGYAVAYEETIPELNTVAVPVKNGYGGIIAAIGVSGPKSRFDSSAIDKLVPHILDAGASIAAELGFEERS